MGDWCRDGEGLGDWYSNGIGGEICVVIGLEWVIGGNGGEWGIGVGMGRGWGIGMVMGLEGGFVW